MTEHTEQLANYIRKIINDYEADIEIAPAFIAREVMAEIDPSCLSPILVSYAANHQLRQMARQELRKEFDPIKTDKQQEMFEGLQERYPCKRHGGCVYVLRSELTEDEYRVNIERMQREVFSKQQHVDALIAERDYKFPQVHNSEFSQAR